MTSWKIQLWTPGHPPPADGRTFGCAVHGFAAGTDWRNPTEPASVAWPRAVTGDVVAGRYADVVRQAAMVRDVVAAVALFARADGMEPFLRDLPASLRQVPMTGGAAARVTGRSHGETLPAAADVALLLIQQGRYRVETLNLHAPQAGQTVEYRAAGPRRLTHLRLATGSDWQPAAIFYRSRQAELGLPAEDHESLTFSDAAGRNLHFATDGDDLVCGANLPANESKLQLRHVTRPNVARQLTEFCREPDSLVFACAGLRGMLDGRLLTGLGAVAGFMFGELVMLDGVPQFGNLMATKLVPVTP